MKQFIEAFYREESRQVLATLIRLLGDFDLAEDAMQDAFSTALEQWSKTGAPNNPRSWLISTGRFKAIDRLRRQARFDPIEKNHVRQLESQAWDPTTRLDSEIEDDMLRLIFVCCHPALPLEGRTAMTLREVCDLTTEEIARAFLVTASTLAQRIVRCKAKIRAENIPFELPPKDELPGRLGSVLQVIYLVFNEGYFASSGEQLIRRRLSDEAIHLGRLLHELLPNPEVTGLLSLMLLQASRQAARTTPAGEIVLLQDQDRSLWDRKLIAEGTALAKLAFSAGRPGQYTLQAGIAAVHAAAIHSDATDWRQISALYKRLLQINPSPVIELNLAVAIAMDQGPEAGLQLIDSILGRGMLTDYHLAYAARADLYEKTGRIEEARASWNRALSLTTQAPERRFIERKINELST